MRCNGDSCNFGSLLNSEGKLGNNWVRAALLSVERSANSRFDLEELFDLLDTKGEGTLKADVVEDLINELGDAAAKVDPKKIYEDAAEVRATTNEISFEQFIAAWEKNGFNLTDNDESLKKKFSFSKLD
jgi:Ca2+-binding EF-hand superfamily protein